MFNLSGDGPSLPTPRSLLNSVYRCPPKIRWGSAVFLYVLVKDRILLDRSPPMPKPLIRLLNGRTTTYAESRWAGTQIANRNKDRA